jgi:hypothetical protein
MFTTCQPGDLDDGQTAWWADPANAFDRRGWV